MTTVTIQEYSQTDAALAILAEKYGATLFDVATTTGMVEAKKARAEIRGYRTSLEAKRKDIKAPALERCRLIDTEAKRITEALLRLETPIDEVIKKEEARREEERQAKANAEAARIAKAREEVDAIRGAVLMAAGETSATVAQQIAELEAADVARSDEFDAEAKRAKAETLVKLGEMRNAAAAHEAEQARIAADRAELAKLRADQEARDQEARAKIGQEQREARERIAAEEKAAQAKRDQADAEARAARAKADADARAVRDAEEAKLQDERERIAAERDAADAVARKAREAEQAKAREEQRQRDESLGARAMLEAFVERYGALEEFAVVTRAIKACLDGTATNRKRRQ